MNRSDIAVAMAAASGVSKSVAEKALNAALASVTEELVAGRRVTLAGFGTFRPVARRARTGRDPRTGGRIAIAPHNSVHFVVSPDFKEQLNSAAEVAVASANG